MMTRRTTPRRGSRRAPPRLRACRGSRRCSCQQEQAAEEQDQIAARDIVPDNGEPRRRQPDDPGEREQQHDARDHRAQQAEAACARLLRDGQLPGEDGDEDDVVDAEDDLEERQRPEGNPSLWVSNPVHHLLCMSKRSSAKPVAGRSTCRAFASRSAHRSCGVHSSDSAPTRRFAPFVDLRVYRGRGPRATTSRPPRGVRRRSRWAGAESAASRTMTCSIADVTRRTLPLPR